MYRERPSPLPGVLAWVDQPRRTRLVLPDGCMDIIWEGATLFVAGPDTIAKPAHTPPGGSFAAIRFPPGVGPAVLGHLANELRDLRIPLAELWGGRPSSRGLRKRKAVRYPVCVPGCDREARE
jgi:hypothetical protein